jgi:hypothetical protein
MPAGNSSLIPNPIQDIGAANGNRSKKGRSKTSTAGESDGFRTTADNRLVGWLTMSSMRGVEPSCFPSLAFTSNGPLVYHWQIEREGRDTDF